MLARGSESLHAMLEALEFSRRALTSVVVVGLVWLVVFCVVGMQLFRGSLFYCSDPFYPEGRPLDGDRCDADDADDCANPDDFPAGCGGYYPNGSYGTDVDPPRYPPHYRANVAGPFTAQHRAHVRRRTHHFDSFGPVWKSNTSWFKSNSFSPVLEPFVLAPRVLDDWKESLSKFVSC